MCFGLGFEAKGQDGGDGGGGAVKPSQRFSALIDTGALITGYSNYEVAQQLLKRGLTWCDGVVFLDDADKQQFAAQLYDLRWWSA